MAKNTVIVAVLFLAMVCISFSGCQDDDDANFLLEVQEGDLAWLSPYSDFARGDTLRGPEESFIIIENQRASVIPSDCQVDTTTYQCHYNVITLSFHSPAETRVTYLTIFVYANRKLIVNYSKVSSLEPEIFFHDLANSTTIAPQSNSFIVDYSEQNEAFLVETIDTSLLFASLPPAKFYMTKDAGVTRWSDYQGNEYVVSF